MATINVPANDRRHTPERRSTASLARSGSTLSALDWVAMILMIVGGLNWGLVGAFEFNLVTALFGEGTALTRLVYVLVGLASLYGIYTLAKQAGRKS